MSAPSFRTEIRLKSPSWKINLPEQFFCVGSCFTEHIHHKLTRSGFYSYSNPAGIVYNPISLLHQIDRTIHGEPWKETDLIHHHGLYHGIFHHGSFSSSDQSRTLDKMNSTLEEAHQHLKQTNLLLITFGSSIVYQHKTKECIVANCHKIPANEFERRFLDKAEIITAFDQTITLLQSIRPDIKIILTISPVRYLKEGFVDNSYSKSVLISAVREITRKYESVDYFPAYEIMLDDLRDYRFYKEDMIHPNEQAVDYIWSKFTETYFEKDTISMMKEVNGIHQSRQHRPLYPETREHELFLKDLEKKIDDIKRRYPFVRL